MESVIVIVGGERPAIRVYFRVGGVEGQGFYGIARRSPTRLLISTHAGRVREGGIAPWKGERFEVEGRGFGRCGWEKGKGDEGSLFCLRVHQRFMELTLFVDDLVMTWLPP